MCGGTIPARNVLNTVNGLSPRVRGNLRLQQPGFGAARSIPACAGEPPQNFVVDANNGVYPRVCGEPAGGHETSAGAGVYPRVCGGTATSSRTTSPSTGLSPRVRGNPYWSHNRGRCRRSIPACAGEPETNVLKVMENAVYPRVCGGTGRGPSRRSEEKGLSPRVRGNPPPAGRAGLGDGSIPACAGEPRCPRSLSRPCGVYPACAGEPVLPSIVESPATVYPRVCGGTSDRDPDRAEQIGLSPRVRGNPP